MADLNDTQIENISAIYLDKEKGEQFIFTRDLLIHQLQSVCPEIEKSFDNVFSEEFKILSSDLSDVLALQFVGYRKAVEIKSELLTTCGDLLRNSAFTIIASNQALRSGFRFQSGILLRSVIEMCATVVHLLVKPEDLKKFLANELSSTKSITIADKQIPLFGKVWGLLSKKHIHINSLHLDWYPMKEFKDKEEMPAVVTLRMIGFSILIMAIVTELVFIDEVELPKYWKRIGQNQLELIPLDSSQYSWLEQPLQ